MDLNSQHIFLRIIAGSLKGLQFDAPKGGKTVRPISDRVKESLFDILAPRLYQASVLDVFSGTGAIGFEALSRGASRVHYCERDPRNISLIRKNAEKLGVSANIELTRGSAPQVFDRISKQFDLIFMDPPFPDDNMEALLKSVFDRKLLSKNGLITIQRFRGSKDIEAGPFELLRKHRVGDSMLWFFEYPLALKEERSVTT